MVQSLLRTLRVDPGFRTDHLLTAQLSISPTRYGTPELSHAFVERLLDELHARPELSEAAISNYATLGGGLAVQTFDPATLGLAEKTTTWEFKSVDPGYFKTVGIALLSGRVFTARDTAAAPRVVIINESLARRFLPGQNPLGRELTFDSVRTQQKNRSQIVGVVADVRDVLLRDQVRPELYTPLLQQLGLETLHLYVRTQAENPEELSSSLRQSPMLKVWRRPSRNPSPSRASAPFCCARSQPRGWR
jgi:putative ABC transport system permease protein